MARTNALLASLLILFGGVYLWLTLGVPPRRLPHDPGIVFVPRVLGAGLVVLSVLLLLQQVVRRLPRPDEAPPERLSAREWTRTAALLGFTIGYVALLPWLGFLVATPLFVTAALLVAGAGARPGTAVAALAVTGVIYVAFVYFFRVRLP